MEILINNWELISSGTIITVYNEPTTFKIIDVVFEFHFRDNNTQLDQNIESTVSEDGKKLIIYFENFNNSLGIGNKEPMKIGFIGEKDIYLIYRVYSLIPEAGKLFHYTWLYKTKELEDGK